MTPEKWLTQLKVAVINQEISQIRECIEDMPTFLDKSQNLKSEAMSYLHHAKKILTQENTQLGKLMQENRKQKRLYQSLKNIQMGYQDIYI